MIGFTNKPLVSLFRGNISNSFFKNEKLENVNGANWQNNNQPFLILLW